MFKSGVCCKPEKAIFVLILSHYPMKRLKSAWSWLLGKSAPKPVYSFGQKAEDGFSPVLKDGKETNCRMYLWDRKEAEYLAALGREIVVKN